MEVERLQAVEAATEVGLDRVERLLRELVVEERLELSQRLLAVTHALTLPIRRLWRSSSRRRLDAAGGLAPPQSPPTASASPFFPGAIVT